MTDIKPDLVITDLSSPAPDNPLEALSWLGDTVEEVVEGLRARGIKGQRKIADQCPLANYLRIWYPTASIYDDVSVMDDKVNYYYTTKTPDVPWCFIHKFDSGDFPDLIDNG